MMKSVAQEIRSSATRSIVISVLMMISGVFAMFVPPVAGLTATMMFGWLLLFSGALHLAMAWRSERTAAVIGEIALAALYAAIGLYMLGRPLAGLASLTLALAAAMVAKGLLEGIIAFNLRPLPGTGWLLLDGIVTVVIAALIAASWPASSVWVIGTLVGVMLFSGGFARLMVSTAIRRAVA